VIQELGEKGMSKMKCFGSSMTPILKSGCLNTYKREESYRVGDIVFCKVKGRYIDAHKITAISPGRGYLISNNHGFDNGWTKEIYGRLICSEYNKSIKDFDPHR